MFFMFNRFHLRTIIYKIKYVDSFRKYSYFPLLYAQNILLKHRDLASDETISFYNYKIIWIIIVIILINHNLGKFSSVR